MCADLKVYKLTKLILRHLYYTRSICIHERHPTETYLIMLLKIYSDYAHAKLTLFANGLYNEADIWCVFIVLDQTIMHVFSVLPYDAYIKIFKVTGI